MTLELLPSNLYATSFGSKRRLHRPKSRVSGLLARSAWRTVAFVKIVTPLARLLHLLCISSLTFDNAADAVLTIAPKAMTQERPRGILKTACARLSTRKWLASVQDGQVNSSLHHILGKAHKYLLYSKLHC